MGLGWWAGSSLAEEWLNPGDIKARTNGGRVLWDNFWGTKKDNMDSQCSAHGMHNKGTISDNEALATLSVWVPVP